MSSGTNRASSNQPVHAVFQRIFVFCLCILISCGSYIRPVSAQESDGETEANKAKAPLDEHAFVDTYNNNFVHKFLPPGSYMTPAEVKPGMTGYGLSVFQGSTIEKFDITVIGVLKKVMSGRDAILVKMGGQAMDKNNVIRGMSGSPCYINGKLIGAVSFGYDFSKEPIAGVTPIVDMLDSLADSSDNAKTPLAKAEHGFNVPWNQSGLSNVSSGELHMSPLVSPVALAGFSPNAEKFLSSRFKDLGMMVSSGSSGGMNSSGLNPAAYSQIKPGSAVGVVLTSGDFTTVATGTTTARFGNKVVAFGHPFMSAGAIEFPMTTSVVHKVLPSLSVSFKLASPISEVGTFTADRPWACGGTVGKASKMIPCSFEIVDETRKIQRTFNSKVIDHPDMTAQLIAATTMSAVDATHQYAGPYVAKVESRIEADGIEPLVRTDRFASNIAAHSILEMLMGFMMGNSVAGSVFRNTSSITSNEFQKASIKSFKIKVTLEDGHQTATIDRVYVEKAYAAPGEQVKVMCLVRPYNKEQKVETLSFQIPRDAPDGNLVIGVAGGDQIDYIKHRMGLSDAEPESLKQIVDELRKQGRGDALNLVVGLPEQTLVMDGVKIPDPPSHWSKVLFSNKHTRGPQIVKGELQQSKLTDYMLYGSHILTVEVRNPDKAAAKSVPSAMPSYLGGDDPAMTDLARKTLGSASYTGRSKSSSSGSGITVVQGAIAGAVVVQTSGSTSTTTVAPKPSTAAGSMFSSAGKLYPHMRLHQIWRQETEDDFRNGKSEGTTIDSWGRISPGLETVASKYIPPDTTVWAGVWTQGNFYFSTDKDIWKWKGDDSKPEKFAKLDASIIPALAADSSGTIYAAAVPNGGVYAIPAGGGTPKQIFKPAEPVVTTLCTDDNDNLYVGVAGNGKVYQVDKNRNSSLKFDSGQAHITALFYSKAHKQLYVGTAEKGSVYRIDENGKAKSIYQTPDHIVTGIAKTKGGDVYVATANQGKLVRILNSGDAQSLASSEAFYTLYYDADHDAVFSGDGEGDITMAAIDRVTEQPYFIPVCHTDQEAVMAIGSNGKQLLVGSTNLSVLKSFNLSSAKTPYYESKVKDAGRIANWVRLRTSGPFTELDPTVASHIKVESRTGNTSMEDSTWSNWSAATYDGESFLLSSPAGRFLQYKITWTSTLDGNNIKSEGPQIGRVDVVYMPKDVAPQFSTISLKAASAVNGKQDVNVTGTDADGDNMLCSIDISADGGKTWEKLITDLRPKTAKKESAVKEATKEGSKESDKEGSKDTSKESSKDSSKEGTKDSGKDSGKEPTKEPDKDKKSESGSGKDKSQTDKADKTAPKSEQSKDEKRHRGNSKKGSDSEGDRKKQSADESRRVPLEGDQPDKNENKDENKDSDNKDSSKDSGDSDKDKDKDQDKDKDKDKEKEKDNAPDRDDKKDDDKKDDDKKKNSKTKSARGASGTSTTSSSSGKASEGASSESFSYHWDTAKQKDGNYILKFILDDRLSNPEDHHRTINVRAVTVDNTAPEIELIECKRKPNNKVECKVVAKDKQSPIVNAMFRFDEGEYFAFAATSNTSDGLSSTLVATDVPCAANLKKIEIKVSDRAGNTATKSANIK